AHRPTVFDRHVSALGISGLAEALLPCTYQGHVQVRRRAIDEPNHWQPLLLGARGERPRRCNTSNDEIAPPHGLPLKPRRIHYHIDVALCMTAKLAARCPSRVLAVLKRFPVRGRN